MPKDKTMYVCSNCGQESPKWIGKCPSCFQWNTFKEIKVAAHTTSSMAAHSTAKALQSPLAKDNKPQPLTAITYTSQPRISTLDPELDRVLGGGLVPGSIVLLGGEPGIGKSTLTLQTILGLSEMRVLYVSGEESPQQLKMRAERLSAALPDSPASPIANENLLILAETSLEAIFEHIREVQPQLLIIDSIQTIETEDVDSSPGSVSQVRECASALLRFAKTSQVPVLLIGHINKEGSLAGPKILEHIVDTVIQFEGDQQHIYRILRSIKNRFGSTAELGIYEMQNTGLRPVTNPSELLLTHHDEALSGIAISAAIEEIGRAHV